MSRYPIEVAPCRYLSAAVIRFPINTDNNMGDISLRVALIAEDNALYFADRKTRPVMSRALVQVLDLMA